MMGGTGTENKEQGWERSCSPLVSRELLSLFQTDRNTFTLLSNRSLITSEKQQKDKSMKHLSLVKFSNTGIFKAHH